VISPLAPVTKAVNPKDGLTYVWIPPGRFMMGCSPGDAECSDHEKPAHEVTITRGFWLGQTPVTQRAYQRVDRQDPSYVKGPNLPVEMVSSDNAKAYCTAIGGRLPTEAEWEYAARAGSTGARYGDLNEIAWYQGNSGGKTHEVGQKLPNAFGLYDMLGRVWQWVADWVGDENQSGKIISIKCSPHDGCPQSRVADWDGNYKPGAQTDPSGAESGEVRALRGGAWNYDPGVVRVSYRGARWPGDSSDSIGFRCAVDEPLLRRIVKQ
jgi:formylglycine-generating enzyme required for sulfatase activity